MSLGVTVSCATLLTHLKAIPSCILGGTAGAGKSTIRPLLAEKLKFISIQSDSFHSEPSIAEMSLGALLDDDVISD